MSTMLRTTTWAPVGAPSAGELIPGDAPTVPIHLGGAQALMVDDPRFARELANAAVMAAGLLEALTAPGKPPAEPQTLGASLRLVEERDAYRALLARLVGGELAETVGHDARMALEFWDGQR